MTLVSMTARTISQQETVPDFIMSDLFRENIYLVLQNVNCSTL